MFSISREQIAELNADQESQQNARRLAELGGAQGLADALASDTRKGLGGADTAARVEAFGSNSMPPPDEETWLELFVAAFEDTTVVILCVSAVVSLAVGVYDNPQSGWIEGCAILAAVLIVAVVTATNDHNKAKQFRALNAVKDNYLARAVRGGQIVQVSVTELVVGDVIALEAGDKVPADAVFVRGNDLQCDESALTGETDDMFKDASGDPFLLSGCEVKGGSCVALVIAVGEQSRWGRIKAKLAGAAENTPLQEKLDDLAQLIGYVGMGAAAATFIAMMCLWSATRANKTRAPGRSRRETCEAEAAPYIPLALYVCVCVCVYRARAGT